MNFNIWNVRDELVEDEFIFDNVSSVGEVMRLAFELPYDNEYLSDSISTPNAQSMDSELDQLATLLNKKLPEGMQGIDKHRFLMHNGVTVRALKGENDNLKATAVYTPFILRFKDKQTLTALVKNEGNSKRFDPSKPVTVHRWAVNNKDVTKFIHKGDDTSSDISTSQLTTAISKILRMTHNKFVKKNPNLSHIAELEEDIRSIKVEIAFIDYMKGDSTPQTPKVRPQKTLEEEHGDPIEELRRKIDDYIADYVGIPLEEKKEDTTLIQVMAEKVAATLEEFDDDDSVEVGDIEESFMETFGKLWSELDV